MSKRLDKLIADLENGWCLMSISHDNVWVFELRKPYGSLRSRAQTLRWSSPSDKEQRAVAAIWGAVVKGNIDPELRRIRKETHRGALPSM
jgi:hypothetical protein